MKKQKQTIVYKIGRVESSSLIIVILPKENVSESIMISWYYNPENPDKWTGPFISASYDTFNLYDFLGTIRDANIIHKSSPEEVISFLDNHQVKRAFHVSIKLPDQKNLEGILITEKEKKSGRIKVNGNEYIISPELQQQLEEMKAQHHIAPPKS